MQFGDRCCSLRQAQPLGAGVGAGVFLSKGP